MSQLHPNTKQAITRRVERGAALLTEKWGSEKWQERIALNNLNISSYWNCIVGQLYGDYGFVDELVGGQNEIATKDRAVQHGFTIAYKNSSGESEWDDAYALALQEEWVNHIDNMRAVAVLV